MRYPLLSEEYPALPCAEDVLLVWSGLYVALVVAAIVLPANNWTECST